VETEGDEGGEGANEYTLVGIPATNIAAINDMKTANTTNA
jgi:hypothetical protein